MSRSAAFLAVAIAAIAPPLFAAEAAPAAKPVDVVICLDTSNSMDGLIASAKIKLWDIVNDLAKVQPAPDLRVALYSYGNDGYDRARGWVRKELDLTADLDEIYRKLNALTTNGGEEYVARVCRDALAEQKWSADPSALKIIFVCGNEPASQDRTVTLNSVGDKAKSQGVIINPIFCGPAGHKDATDWKEFAVMAGGRFASIDQDRGSVAIATPFDKELGDLSSKLNTTYLAFGRQAQEKAANQAEQDLNAAKLSASAAASRATTKGGALYRNAEWDLVDHLKEDPKFDVTKVPEADLPEEMRKLKPEERAAYVKKKADERAAMQKQIAEVSGKRDGFVREYQKKNPSAAEKAFDAAIRQMLREQAATKGLIIP
jgi:von Willebrand factor type A domain